MYLSKRWNINKSKHCRWEEGGLAGEQPGGKERPGPSGCHSDRVGTLSIY